MSYGPPAD
jgi:hypothetical protein